MTPDPARTLNLGRKLHPSKNLLLERGFVAGSPKTGKTSTCVVLVEEADRLGINSAVLTPNDVWHGIRTHGDGEKPGLDHVIFGGSFGDRPLEANMGRGLARAVAGGLRVVLVLAGMRFDDRARLVADFCEELLEVNRTPLLIVVDEAHLLAPNGSAGGEDKPSREVRKRCREALTTVAAAGRMPALIGLWVVTQRLARLHTDLRELADASIIHKLRGGNDQSTAAGYLADYLDDASQLDRIGKLKRGEAFVVSTETDVAGVFQIRMKWTFDTSNSDDALEGNVREPMGRSTIDLSALDLTLGDALKEAQEHDPATLRARVRELEQKLEARPVSSLPSKVVDAELAAAVADANALRGEIADAYGERDGLKDAVELIGQELEAARARVGELERLGLELVTEGPAFHAHAQRLHVLARHLPRADDDTARAASGRAIALIEDNQTASDGEPVYTGATRTPPDQGAPTPPPPKPAPQAGDDDRPTLKAGHGRILEALSRYRRRGLTRAELVPLAQFASARTVGDYIAYLKGVGYVEENGDGLLQADGGALGVVFDDPPLEPWNRVEVYGMQAAKLKAGHRRMLDALFRTHPEGFTRKELAGVVGMNARTAGDYVAHLKKHGLVDERAKRIFASYIFYLGED